MDFLKVNLKAIVAFVLTTVAQAVSDALNSETPPATLADWGRYLGFAVVAAVVVWATGNKLDLGQILAGTKKLDVPEQAQVAREALTELPDTVSDRVVKTYPNWATG